MLILTGGLGVGKLTLQGRARAGWAMGIWLRALRLRSWPFTIKVVFRCFTLSTPPGACLRARGNGIFEVLGYDGCLPAEWGDNCQTS